MTVRSLPKKWWFWVLLLVIGSIVLLVIKSQPKTSYQTETLQREPLVQSVDVSGDVVSIDQVDLAFDVGGSLAEVLVSVGDVVEKGAVLAKLDTKELEADVQAAYQSAQYAQANLDKVKIGQKRETVNVSSEAVRGSEALLHVAKIDLENAKSYLQATKERYEADVVSAQTTVESAQDDVKQVERLNAQTLSDAYRDLYVVSLSGVISARTALVESDDVLGVRNGYANDDFEKVLSARDESVLTIAKDRYLDAEASLHTAETALSATTISSNQSTILQTGRLVEKALDDAGKLALYTKKVVDATLTTTNFTLDDLSALKTNIDSVRNAVQADQTSVENALQGVESVLNSTRSSLEDAQNTLSAAKASLNLTQKVASQQIASLANAVSSSEATVLVRESDLAKSQASLTELQSAPRAIDLASYEADVARTIASYQSAKARLEKAVIVSPIAGNVTRIDSEIGETIMASTPVVTVQTTEQQFKILANVSESDVTKVAINDLVSISFDAYTGKPALMGVVAEINPAEKLIEGVVYYEATIYLNQGEEATLRPGMSADLVIETEKREAVLSVPQRTVVQKNGGFIVRILEKNKPVDRDITTGIRGNLGRIEILSGLQEGDLVIVKEIHE